MKIIACVDNDMGLMFHQRRQSQDRVVREKINQLQEVIYMNLYSYQLYHDIVERIIVHDQFLTVGKDHFCLIENVSVYQYSDIIEEIHLFKWNRKYPADFYLDIQMNQYQCIYEEEFNGSSHNKITYQIYRKDT